jgi:hypothetical protein
MKAKLKKGDKVRSRWRGHRRVDGVVMGVRDLGAMGIQVTFRFTCPCCKCVLDFEANEDWFEKVV